MAAAVAARDAAVLSAGEAAGEGDGAAVPPDEAALTAALHGDGFVAVRGVADLGLLEECRCASLAALAECFEAMASRGEPVPPGVGQRGGYREIVRRHVGRYENRHGVSVGALSELRAAVEGSAAHRVAVAALGGEAVVLGCSCVVAEAGCEAQAWHVDGGHVNAAKHEPVHCLNVFVPLVDVSGGGGTEFKPGSHFLTRDLKRLMLLARIKKQLRSPVAPRLRPGDAVLFDYRVLHRGTLNTTGGPRPVFVLTLAKPWFRDLLNFPKRALFPGERLAVDDLAAPRADGEAGATEDPT